MVDHLSKGLSSVTNAVQLDGAMNYKEAIHMYDLALFHLKLALVSMYLFFLVTFSYTKYKYIFNIIYS